MQRVWYFAMAFGFGIVLFWPHSARSTPMEPVNVGRNQWMKTMEASVDKKDGHAGSLRVDAGFGDAPLSPEDPNFVAWLGWFLAGAFFLVLLNLHIKMKRRQELLLHGDGPDLFLLPPANNRRRRPR